MKNVRETSKESFKEVKKNLGERYKVCLRGLSELGEATANELAMHLTNSNVLPFFNRNFVHPRLTEMVDKKLIVEVGKKIDPISGRKCMIYKAI